MVNKAIVATVVGAISTLLFVVGIDISAELQAAITTVILAIAVYAVPNQPA